jgi:surfeit locus 1 family protein
MDMDRRLLTPRWLITTLLVLVAVGVMVRLGIWQLDRLHQRREANARIQAQIDAPALDLNQSIPINDLYDMEYRQVIVRGTYDPQNEIILRGQARDGLPGHHLLTPLRIQGSDQSVLVDRGFIPLEDEKPAARTKYAISGPVEVRGVIRRSQSNRRFGVADPTLAPGETRRDAWNAVRLDRIASQSPYPLLPVYVEAQPDAAQAGPPFPQTEAPDLSEGPHMGYAIQWFSFAAILAVGYPFFVCKQLEEPRQTKSGGPYTV